MISEEQFNYYDLLLMEWGRWVRSEYIGNSLAKFSTSIGTPINDDDALAIDLAVARCNEGTRKLIKRVYLWRDITIDARILKQHINDFVKEYSRDVA